MEVDRADVPEGMDIEKWNFVEALADKIEDHGGIFPIAKVYNDPNMLALRQQINDREWQQSVRNVVAAAPDFFHLVDGTNEIATARAYEEGIVEQGADGKCRRKAGMYDRLKPAARTKLVVPNPDARKAIAERQDPRLKQNLPSLNGPPNKTGTNLASRTQNTKVAGRGYNTFNAQQGESPLPGQKAANFGMLSKKPLVGATKNAALPRLVTGLMGRMPQLATLPANALAKRGSALDGPAAKRQKVNNSLIAPTTMPGLGGLPAGEAQNRSEQRTREFTTIMLRMRAAMVDVEHTNTFQAIVHDVVNWSKTRHKIMDLGQMGKHSKINGLVPGGGAESKGTVRCGGLENGAGSGTIGHLGEVGSGAVIGPPPQAKKGKGKNAGKTSASNASKPDGPKPANPWRPYANITDVSGQNRSVMDMNTALFEELFFSLKADHEAKRDLDPQLVGRDLGSLSEQELVTLGIPYEELELIPQQLQIQCNGKVGVRSFMGCYNKVFQAKDNPKIFPKPLVYLKEGFEHMFEVYQEAIEVGVMPDGHGPAGGPAGGKKSKAPPLNFSNFSGSGATSCFLINEPGSLISGVGGPGTMLKGKGKKGKTQKALPEGQKKGSAKPNPWRIYANITDVSGQNRSLEEMNTVLFEELFLNLKQTHEAKLALDPELSGRDLESLIEQNLLRLAISYDDLQCVPQSLQIQCNGKVGVRSFMGCYNKVFQAKDNPSQFSTPHVHLKEGFEHKFQIYMQAIQNGTTPNF